MAFSSATRSWKICNGNQQRTAKAYAVFTKLASFPGQIRSVFSGVRSNLLQKIRALESASPENLTESEEKLFMYKKFITDFTGDVSSIEKLEVVFSVLEPFAIFSGSAIIKTPDIKEYLKQGQVSRILRAISTFKWKTGLYQAPEEKSSSDIGISDDVLDKLMEQSGAVSLLESWLQAGDARWKQWVDSEIVKRKQELEREKSIHSTSARAHVLESEIKKFEKDWAL